MNEKFNKDLCKLYELSTKKEEEINDYFLILENENDSRKKIIDDFLLSINLEISKESRFALLTRLIFLRDTSLVQLLKSKKFEDKQINEIKAKAYEWVKEFHTLKQKELVSELQEKKSFNSFL